MKIRSITTFLDPGWPLDEDILQKAGEFIDIARPAIEAVGYEVQTTRLATVPFPRLISDCETDEVIRFARAIEGAAREQGYDYVSIGPALPENLRGYAVLPEVFAATETVFASGVLAAENGEISLPAVRACAEVMVRCADLDANGFGNMYFAALANVPPGAPFFPAAYHGGGSSTFAIATEAASLAVEAFSGVDILVEARQNLVATMEAHGHALAYASEELSAQFGIGFGGIDLTLAPFPEESLSLGTALERLGVPVIGLHGSLAAAAFLADAIDRANFPRAGFCGLMLPVLEDSVLAARTAEGTLTVTDLLLYSAVCGTGLDTIPLPGDTTPEQLTALLLDLAALSLRLEKPLTARVMPIPGKSAGDLTGFDFPYFANSRVLGLRAENLEGHFAGNEVFELRRRS